MEPVRNSETNQSPDTVPTGGAGPTTGEATESESGQQLDQNSSLESSSESSSESSPNTPHSAPDPAVLERLRVEPAAVMADAFAAEYQRLWQLVTFRMDHRIAGRVDADDVLQESFLAAEKRIQHYLKSPKCSLFVWLRMVVTQTLVDIHRRHLGADMRSVGREINLAGAKFPQSTCVSMARQLMASQTSPSGAMIRKESSVELEEAISQMPPLDQETIALRHFEGLSNSETAEVLGISVTAASNRYVRALSRLRDVLENWESAQQKSNQPDIDGHSS